MTDRVTLPWIDSDLRPNAARRIHWTRRARIAAHARFEAKLLAMDAGLIIPADADLAMTVVFHPPTRRHYDIDGLLSALKPSIDGIFEACGADDAQVKQSPF